MNKGTLPTSQADLLSFCLVFLVLFSCISMTASAGIITASYPGDPGVVSDNSSQSSNATVRTELLKAPLSFIPNEGQADPEIRFMVKGSGTAFSFISDRMLISMDNETPDASPITIAQEFLGANRSVSITGEDLLPGVANFILGNNSSSWHAGLSTYGAIRYRDLWPGIDLVYRGNGSVLKREFVVAPGGDPNQIQMVFKEADEIRTGSDGSLTISAGAGSLAESAPVCYQVGDREPALVKGEYRVENGNKVSFTVGEYNRSLPLVIDPDLVYSTYLGASGGDQGYNIAVNESGCAFVTGATTSDDFPTEQSFWSSYRGGDTDAFVSVFNPSGDCIYSTYLGGNGEDYGYSIVAGTNGDAYITGRTTSTDFPALLLPYQTAFGGGEDAFITVLDHTGGSPRYSTYLGGSGSDYAQGIDIDGSGHVYVTGQTTGNFPTYQASQVDYGGGNGDAFVVKLDPQNNGDRDLEYSTYLGGRSKDIGYDIAINESGYAYITGYTQSDNFPTSLDPYQLSFGGGYYDAYVAVFKPSGTCTYSTYLGGSEDDYGWGIAAKGSSAYVAGGAGDGFPLKNALQNIYGGHKDAFVTKLNCSSSSLEYSTYLGGAEFDDANNIDVDDSGNAYVTGGTYSDDFPLKYPYQNTFGGGDYDAFVIKLNSTGSGLVYSTYLGGSDKDWSKDIDVDESGNAYVTGETVSSNFPRKNAYQNTYINGGDAFVTKIAAFSVPEITSISPASGKQGGTYPVNITGIDFETGTATVTFSGSGVSAGSYTTRTDTQINCTVTIDSAAATGARTLTVTNPTTGATETGTFTVTAGPAITTISPASGQQGATYQVNITGTGFEADQSTITISGAGVSAGSYTTRTATQINCSVTIDPTAATGARTLTVNNPIERTAVPGTFTVTAGLEITTISPASGQQGATYQVNITGTGFEADQSTIAISGTGVLTGSYTSRTATQINCTVTIDPAATTGARTLTVANPIGGITVTGTFTVEPAPAITSISPASGQQGGTYAVNITGTGFEPDKSTITFSGADISAGSYTTRTATQINCTVTIGSTAATGARTLTVNNPTGGVTVSGTFTVEPAPAITTVIPASGQQGGTYTVIITGTNYELDKSTVTVSGTGVTVGAYTKRNATHIIAPFTIAPSASAGARTVTITNPTGGAKATSTFTIGAGPAITTISPPSVQQGGAYTVTITGTGFEPDKSLVTISGTGVTVGTYTKRNATHIIAPFTIASAAATGARTVTITNPTGGAKATSTFTIGTGPAISSVSPSTGQQGGTYTITITGINFEPDKSTVSVSGTGVTVGAYAKRNATHIIAPFTIASAAATGARTVTVRNPTSGATATRTFTIGTGPAISSVSPSTGQQGGTYTITITGTNFEPDKSTVTVSGTGVTVGAYAKRNATHIIAPFTIASAAATGARTVTVRNPTSGATVTSTFTIGTGPVITSVSPSTGQPAGTYTVTITGTCFEPDKSTVTITGTGVTIGAYTKRNATQITAPFTIASSAVPGTRTVTVRNPTSGATATSTFTVGTGPVITTISPATGYAKSSLPVTISGTGFATSTAILKQGTTTITGTGTAGKTSTSTVLYITFPINGAPAGLYNLTVRNAAGPAVTKLSAFTVIASQGCTITTIRPVTGDTTADRRIEITGTGFKAGAMVTLTNGVKSYVCTGSSQLGSTSIMVTLPLKTAGVAPGVYSIVVVNTDGTFVSKSNCYTVTAAAGVSAKNGAVRTSPVVTGTGGKPVLAPPVTGRIPNPAQPAGPVTPGLHTPVLKSEVK